MTKYTNNNFLKNLNSFQDTAIETLIKNKNKKIIIISKKFTGKTMLAGKLFEKCANEVVVYHTGCSPKLMKKAKEEFFKLIYEYKGKDISIIVDEFYDDDILDYINNIKNVSLYLFTNDNSIRKKDYLIFNYYNYYKQFIYNEVGEYLNLHQILNKDINFDKKNEKLRRISKSTTTYIKYKENILEYKMEL